MDLAGIDGGLCIFFAVEDTGRAFVHQHFICHGAALDHAAVGSQIALQYGDAAGLGVGLFYRTNHGRITVDGSGDILAQRLAGNSQHGGIQQLQLGKFLQHGVHAAGFVQVFHISGAGGGQMAQVGGLGADGIGDIQIQLDAALIGDGRQMQHAVGGAAQGHVGGEGIAEGSLGHNVAGTDVLLHQLHHLHTGVFRQLDAGRVNGGDGTVALQTHAQNLGEAVHGVGGIHAGAAAAGGASAFFADGELGGIDLAGIKLAYRLKHAGQAGLFAVDAAGQHGTAADDNGGDIHTGGSHQQAGHVFIAVGHHYHAVKAVGQQHGFGRVSDQVTGDKAVFHALMTHGNAVTDGDGGEYDGRAAGHSYAQLNGIHDFIQIHMAGNDLVIGADHSDQGALLLFGSEAQGMIQAPVRCVLGAVDNGIFDHKGSSF